MYSRSYEEDKKKTNPIWNVEIIFPIEKIFWQFYCKFSTYVAFFEFATCDTHCVPEDCFCFLQFLIYKMLSYGLHAFSNMCIKLIKLKLYLLVQYLCYNILCALHCRVYNVIMLDSNIFVFFKFRKILRFFKFVFWNF